MRKQIEILSLVLAIAVLIGIACGMLVAWIVHPGLGATTTAFFLLHLGIAVWLFQQADPKSNTAGVWAFLGAIAGLVGVLIFFLSEINRKLTVLTHNMESATGQVDAS
jgi:hypothetical protein